MTKIQLSDSGNILLPGKTIQHLSISPGSDIILETRELGLAIHMVRPDVQRVYLEVTTRCNFDCEMCIRQSWSDPQGSMSWETFQSILLGLHDFPDLKRVYFGGYGEPLLHPRILEMVTMLKALGIGITMTTNGLLLKPALARALFEAGLDTLVVSLDSMHVQAYQAISSQSGASQVLQNLHDVSTMIRDGGWKTPILGLEYVAMKDNLQDLYSLPDLARNLGAHFIIVTNLLPHKPDLASQVLYDQDQPLRLGGGWGIHRAGWVAWGVPRLPRMKWGAFRRCRFVNDQGLVIAWDGGVSPCYALMHSYTYYLYERRKDVSRYLLGSVKEKALKDIWMSEEYVLFRAKVRDFRFPSCVDCGMDCSFAQENSDCYGNDPSCADCLWAQDILLCP